MEITEQKQSEHWEVAEKCHRTDKKYQVSVLENQRNSKQDNKKKSMPRHTVAQLQNTKDGKTTLSSSQSEDNRLPSQT